MTKAFKGVDWLLLFSSLLLTSVGVLMIYSASIEADGVDLSFVLRQSAFIFIGVLVYLTIKNIDYRFFAQVSVFLYIFLILLLLLTFLVGSEVRGSVRWIDVGLVSIQASELGKPILILTLATFFSKYQPHSIRNIVFSLAIVLLPAGLVFLQPDLGNAVILFGLWVVLIFAAGVKLIHVGIFTAMAALAGPFFWPLLQEYQKDRLFTFLNPESDPLGSGYNIVQSIIAVGSGGLAGKGFGRGTQSQLNFLPEQKTDFIFATTAEELGLLGVIFVLGCLIIIVYRVSRVSSLVGDGLGSLIAIGTASLVVMHVFINIGMNIGIFPVTGITLPLLSFGGSSLISFMICLGLVNSVLVFSQFKKT